MLMLVALLFFVALLPQFIVNGAPWPFALQIALLGVVHVANCGAVYVGVRRARDRGSGDEQPGSVLRHRVGDR